MRFFREKRTALMTRLSFLLNVLLILLGIFTILSMSVVLGIFEEFTAFTDYTQQWIEFNFFIHYWDKLTISRVYLSFIYIYGGALIAVASFQIHGFRKRDLTILYLAPKVLLFIAIVSLLGALSWLVTTAVNHNEGFLATGGFIFERMRFKGNVWKDLKFREQSFRVVTQNEVPRKAFILDTWVFQRQRDFECCGWDSYMDYSKGNFTSLPESCCKRKYRTFGCGNNYLLEDKTSYLNTRGCGQVMYDWYRSGFNTNIAMAVIGIAIAAFEFYTYSLNRRQYFSLLFELDDMGRPMMNSMSMSTIHSKNSSQVVSPYATSSQANQMMMNPSRTSSTRNILPQIVNSKSGASSSGGGYMKAPLYERPNMSSK